MKRLLLLIVFVQISASQQTRHQLKSICFMNESVDGTKTTMYGRVARSVDFSSGRLVEGQLDASVVFDSSTNIYSGIYLNNNYDPQGPATRILSAAKAQEYFEQFRKARAHQEEVAKMSKKIKRFTDQHGVLALWANGRMDGRLDPAISAAIDAMDEKDEKKES